MKTDVTATALLPIKTSPEVSTTLSIPVSGVASTLSATDFARVLDEHVQARLPATQHIDTKEVLSPVAVAVRSAGAAIAAAVHDAATGADSWKMPAVDTDPVPPPSSDDIPPNQLPILAPIDPGGNILPVKNIPVGQGLPVPELLRQTVSTVAPPGVADVEGHGPPGPRGHESNGAQRLPSNNAVPAVPLGALDTGTGTALVPVLTDSAGLPPATPVPASTLSTNPAEPEFQSRSDRGAEPAANTPALRPNPQLSVRPESLIQSSGPIVTPTAAADAALTIPNAEAVATPPGSSPDAAPGRLIRAATATGEPLPAQRLETAPDGNTSADNAQPAIAIAQSAPAESIRGDGYQQTGAQRGGNGGPDPVVAPASTVTTVAGQGSTGDRNPLLERSGQQSEFGPTPLLRDGAAANSFAVTAATAVPAPAVPVSPPLSSAVSDKQAPGPVSPGPQSSAAANAVTASAVAATIAPVSRVDQDQQSRSPAPQAMEWPAESRPVGIARPVAAQGIVSPALFDAPADTDGPPVTLTVHDAPEPQLTGTAAPVSLAENLPGIPSAAPQGPVTGQPAASAQASQSVQTGKPVSADILQGRDPNISMPVPAQEAAATLAAEAADPAAPSRAANRVGFELPTTPQTVALAPRSIAETQLPATVQQQPLQLSQSSWEPGLQERILWMSSRHLSRAEIQLDPPELGPLQIQISNQRDATSIQFHTQSTIVREMLEQSLPRLREMLESGGLQQVNVDVQQGRGDQRHAPAYAGASADRHQGLDEGDDTLASGALQPRQRLGLVDDYA